MSHVMVVIRTLYDGVIHLLYDFEGCLKQLHFSGVELQCEINLMVFALLLLLTVFFFWRSFHIYLIT